MSEANDPIQAPSSAGELVLVGVAAGVATAVGMVAPPLAVPAAVLAAWAPAFLEKGAQYFNSTVKPRVEAVLGIVLGRQVADPEERKLLEDWFEKEGSFAWETLRRLSKDDEGQKAWAYAALLIAFRKDLIPENQRIHWVTFIEECFNDDLVQLVRGAEIVAFAERCHTEGTPEYGRVMAAFTAAGFKGEASAVFKTAEAAAVDTFRSSTRLKGKMAEFGWLESGNYFSNRLLNQLYPVLREGAIRARIELPSEDDFLALAVAHRRQIG